MINKILNTTNRFMKNNNPLIEKILSYETIYKGLSDEELKNKTLDFKTRLMKGESIDNILPEAYATVIEASSRVLGLRHYYVQILGGLALNKGNIAEMKTGEGKTLVVTLPAYLNAINNKNVHVITVNDYLAKRDKEQMGEVFEFLGLTTALIYNNQDLEEKKAAYKCNVVYGNSTEFAFDYLRDNMTIDINNKVQGTLDYAIIDEVDSILIDEARTPLIISSPKEISSDMYIKVDKFTKALDEIHYEIIEKDKTIMLTEEGIKKAEEYFNLENLSHIENTSTNHYILASLKANYLIKRDIDYIIRNDKIILIDQFTGRLSYGKMYSEGLHQALEAKEDLSISKESTTDATITYQNYYRMYEKLSGMTGTAKTESAEFEGIYNLNVIEIPTNKPMIRKDHIDLIYKTEKAKCQAIIDDIKERYEKGQPVLVGTASVEKSESLSKSLNEIGITHTVLNAKHDEEEAEIIKKAGELHAVTISTNMAGRGTDIVLGKNEIERKKIVNLGGLCVIGTQRHEARRIDNQLRGRSGRQGDPGESRFYLSLEDDLLRIFGGDKVKQIADSIGLENDTPISSPLLYKIVENSQKKLEGINYSQRKSLLMYDNVINIQRKLIYRDRDIILKSSEKELSNYIKKMVEERIKDITNTLIDDKETLKSEVLDIFNMSLRDTDTSEKIIEAILLKYELCFERENIYKSLREDILSIIDKLWIEHIDNINNLRQGIGLRSLGGQNPYTVYEKETFYMYERLTDEINLNIIKNIFLKDRPVIIYN